MAPILTEPMRPMVLLQKNLICWLQNCVYSLSKAMDHQNLIETDVAIDRQTTGVWQSKLNLGIGAPDDTLTK